MAEYVNWFAENWDQVVIGLTLLYGALSVFVTLTPYPQDDVWLAKLKKILVQLSILKPKDVPGVGKLPGAKVTPPQKEVWPKGE